MVPVFHTVPVPVRFIIPVEPNAITRLIELLEANVVPVREYPFRSSVPADKSIVDVVVKAS
jgi:hypothetical protein